MNQDALTEYELIAARIGAVCQRLTDYPYDAVSPEEVTWGHVGTLKSILSHLNDALEITDAN